MDMDTLLTKVCIVKAMVFPAVMYGRESWTIKKAKLQRIDAFELWCWRKLLRVPWTARRSINHKENQPWIFIGRIDAEGETPVLWPPDAKSRFTGKDPNAGKDWGQEKGVTENEMVGWRHWHNGFEFEQTLGDSGRPGNLLCCRPWGHIDQTELSNWTTQPEYIYEESKRVCLGCRFPKEPAKSTSQWERAHLENLCFHLNSLFTIVKTTGRQLQLVGYNASFDLNWVQKAEVGLTEIFI